MNTNLSRKEIETLLAPYGIMELDEFKLLKGGSENTNYLIKTSTKKYVLSICEQKSLKETEQLAELLDHLAHNGFQSSELIRTQNDIPISQWKGKPVMLKAFLEGEILQDLPPHLLNLIGQELGKLHQIPAPDYLPQQISYGIEHFQEVETYAAGSSFHQWLMEIQLYVQPFLNLDLPKALIHSDLFFSNVIVSPDKQRARIMDFEEATYYYRVFDLGMAIIGLCAEGEIVDLEKVRHFLEGYSLEIDMNPEEIGSLKAFTVYAAAAMSFWRHKHFNFTKPEEAMKDHYLELKKLADFVRGLPENGFSGVGGVTEHGGTEDTENL